MFIVMKNQYIKYYFYKQYLSFNKKYDKKSLIATIHSKT